MLDKLPSECSFNAEELTRAGIHRNESSTARHRRHADRSTVWATINSKRFNKG